MPTFAEIMALIREQPEYPNFLERRMQDFSSTSGKLLSPFAALGELGGQPSDDMAAILGAKFGVPPEQFTAPPGPLPPSPPAHSGFESAAQFATKSAPYVLASIGTGGMATAGEQAAMKFGLGKLGQAAVGQATQELAFLPSTIASSKTPQEALTTTALGVLPATVLTRLFGGGLRSAGPSIDEGAIKALEVPEPMMPPGGFEIPPALRYESAPIPKAPPVTSAEIDEALAAPPRVFSEPQKVPVQPGIEPKEAENLTLTGESLHVPLSRTEMNEMRAAIVRNAGGLGIDPTGALKQLEDLERFHQAAIGARTELLADMGQSPGAEVIRSAMQDVAPEAAQRFRMVATQGAPMGRALYKNGIILARIGELSEESSKNMLKHEEAHVIARQIQAKASRGDAPNQQAYDKLREAVSYQPWRMWDPLAEAKAEMAGVRAQWPEDIALRTGKPPGWTKVHGEGDEAKLSERMADMITLMSAPAGREAISPKSRQILEPFFGPFPEGHAPKHAMPGGKTIAVPKEELVHLAPAQVGGKQIEVGTVEAQVQKQELQAKVQEIKTTSARERTEIEEKWGKLTPEQQLTHKESLIEGLRQIYPGRSDKQLRGFLKGGPRTERIIGDLEKKGRLDAVEALELVTGVKRPTQEGVVTVADALRMQGNSSADFGPEATRMFGEELDNLPPGTAERFIRQSEGDLGKYGVPMTTGNLWDRLMYWRRAAMVGSLKTALGNIGSTTLFTATNIPRTALSVALGKAGRAITGVGPERSFGEVSALALGYTQGMTNMVRRLRGQLAEGMVGEGLLRFSEASRSVRTQIEGADPFVGSGAVGSALGGFARNVFKYGLELPDRAMWDVAFSGEMTRKAFQHAFESGARGKQIAPAMREFLDRATREAEAAEAAARGMAEWLAPQEALKRAEFQGNQIRQAAKESLERARGTGRGVDVAQKAYADAIARANALVENAALTPAEKEFLERHILRDMTPQSIEEARFLSERSLFIAQENKRLDNFVTSLQTNPVLKPISDVVLPFKRTPANVAREAVRTSPLGFATALPKLLESGGYAQLKAAGMPFDQAFMQALRQADAAGLTKFYDDLAQATFGTALMYGTYAALDNGLIQIHPFDPKMKKEERLALEAQGIPTDSLVLGKFSIPLYRIEPLGRNLRAAHRIMTLSKENPGMFLADAEGLAQEYVMNMTDDVWLSGMGDLMEAMQDEGAAAKFANKFGGSFVPRIAQDVAALARGERINRKPSEGTFLEFLKGPSQALGGGKADLGLFGKPRAVEALYQLTGFSLRQDDPLLQELTANDYFPSTRLPQADLTEGESQDATQAKGFVQEQALKALIANPQYQELPTPELKRKAMERVIDKVGDRTNKTIRARKAAGMSLSYADLLQVFNAK